MKKKIFFITVAIIETLVFCYLIISADSIIDNELSTMKEAYSIFSSEMQEEMMSSYQANGANILRFFSITGICFNIITVYIALKNAVLRNKGLLITFSVLHIIFGSSGINQLLSIISILVLLCLKRINPEDFPIKKELPKLEEERLNKNEIIIAIVLILVYFSQFILGNFIPDSEVIRIAVSIIFYLLVFVLSLLYWNKKLLNRFKVFGKNFIAYIKFILPRLMGMYVVYFAVAIISAAITGEISSANQDNLESMSKYVVIPLAIIWAPIVEETLFRGLVHKIIKNKYLYIIVSAVIFGLLHTVGQEATVLDTVVKALPYAVLGGFLAYIYDRTNNITTSMFGHAIINTIGSIASFL